LESTIRSFIATQKELNKGCVAKFKEMDALCERVDNLAKFTTLKNFVQEKRSHKETVKYCEEVVEKSWEKLLGF
jgi:hypothetical protein